MGTWTQGAGTPHWMLVILQTQGRPEVALQDAGVHSTPPSSHCLVLHTKSLFLMDRHLSSQLLLEKESHLQVSLQPYPFAK